MAWKRTDEGGYHLAVKNEIISVLRHAELNIRSITTSNLRFRHQEPRSNLPVQQRHQPLLLLLLGAIFREDLHIAGIWRGAIRRLAGSQTAPQILSHEPILQITILGAVFGKMILGEEHVPQTKFLGLCFEILDDLGVGVETLFSRAAQLLLVDGIRRDAFFLDELFYQVEGLFGAFADEWPGHGRDSLRCWDMAIGAVDQAGRWRRRHVGKNSREREVWFNWG